MPTFANALTNGVVNIPLLKEASGIVASRNNPGVLWVEQDSGNAAVVYALDSQGRNLGTYALPGNTDNEDICIGPGPVTNVAYLFIADIGDNSASRANIALYQVPEPAVYFWQTNAPVANRAMKGVRTIKLTYPDGPHNAEAGFVDPATGDWFLLTKASGTSRIYQAPKALLDSTTNIVLTFVRTLGFDVVSGADISPMGNEILVRQEEFAGLWTRTNGQSISNVFASASTAIPVAGTPAEPNGEAVGFDYYGGGYFTVTDDTPTGVQPLRYFARTSFDGPAPPRSLVPPAADWKYLANGSDQGTVWRNQDLDDSNWSDGMAQLGYGDGDEQTVVSYGANAAAKYITTYFRKTFVATNVNRIAGLTLKLVVDDGTKVFLNGAAIASVNLAPGAAYGTLATPMPAALRDTWQSFSVDPNLLREGTNLIAAEVHLASPAGSSLSFDLQLVAAEAPVVTGISRFADRAVLYLAGAGSSPTTIQATTNLCDWTNLGSVLLTNDGGVYADPTATNFPARFYRAARQIP